jgi:hypothetical protein
MPTYNGDFMMDSENISNLSGLGLDYVKIVQSIYREVNINSMRGNRRKYYILKPTGMNGVFVLIYKGTKLRCGELANIVWFKILIDTEVVDQTPRISPSWAFKEMYNAGLIYHSKWISTDVHRLDHYIRAYDKILMAYLSIVHYRYRTETNLVPANSENTYKEGDTEMPISLYDSINRDMTNSLGLIIMTYLEDRRSTSKLLQSVRYLVMGSISMFKYWQSVLEKCVEPVRSPLQLYFFKKMLSFASKMVNHNLYKHYFHGRITYDTTNQMFSDTFGGASLRLPRPIISSHNSSTADFAEILSEMYFCMLFNKNQDDPTHASFQILSKMLEGEQSFHEMKLKENHLGYKKEEDDTKWAKYIINNPHTHQFSSKAIEIGSKLSRLFVGDFLGSDFDVAIRHPSMNKTIDEFATYKSSSKYERDTFDMLKPIQNARVRCIEGVLNLLENNLFRSYDVARETKKEITSFHVFKKNQIGGVREILILPISTRININILETLSRNLCYKDHREALTHGSYKIETLRNMLYESKKKTGKRCQVYLSFDKSKWGPTFVPIQFLYLFKPYKKNLGKMFYYITHLLIRHQNKRCLLPERLVRAWASDPDNIIKHKRDKNLQNLKEKFLKDRKLYFVNESNMGQGILHYTSSLLHLAMLSFRDRLYQMFCSKENLSSDDHEDIVSSDDSFTILSLEYEKRVILYKKIKMFLKIQELSERLFNCRTSKSKSSINPLVGEFNSMFMSNMTFFPTLIKFAIASVHPVNTDSFYRMVKESYSASRQVVENGGSLELYVISSYLNKRYCESIYHTSPGMVNDIRNQEITQIPYQLGIFPIFDPVKMIMFGPEYYNYMIYQKWSELTDKEKQIFKNSHKIIKGGLVETMAEFEEGDTILGGLLRIEARVGPIRQLERIKRASKFDREDLEQFILEDPLLIIRKPNTNAEIMFKTCQKLFLTGAAEAMKNIAASIYYGRVSATVSAEAFYIPKSTTQLQTYKECLNKIIEEKSDIANFDEHMRFLYPKMMDYETTSLLNLNLSDPKIRNIFEIQTITKLVTHKIYTNLTYSVADVIGYMWNKISSPVPDINKIKRDMIILQLYYPLLKDTLEETLDQFSGNKLDKTKATLLLIL